MAAAASPPLAMSTQVALGRNPSAPMDHASRNASSSRFPAAETGDQCEAEGRRVVQRDLPCPAGCAGAVDFEAAAPARAFADIYREPAVQSAEVGRCANVYAGDDHLQLAIVDRCRCSRIGGDREV